MISIKRTNLEQLATIHYGAIKNYIEQSNPKKITELDNAIKSCFGANWDFKKLILAKPYQLEELSRVYKWKCKIDLKYFETLYTYLNSYKDIKFFTLDVRQEKIQYTAYELIESLDISVCPYCNRNTIYNIQNKKKRTSELDHFYPKSIYPCFAVSFYNLVPSCKVCNKIKLDNATKPYINPYDQRFDFHKNMKLSYKPIDISFLYETSGFNLEFNFSQSISSNEKNRIENNLNDFELKNLYQNHKDIVLELIQKAEIYNESYIDELFQNYEGTLFKNREDLLRLITCGYITDEEIHKRPLSKLIKDISEELDLL